MNRIRLFVVFAVCVLQAVGQASGPVATASAERPGPWESSGPPAGPAGRWCGSSAGYALGSSLMKILPICQTTNAMTTNEIRELMKAP